MKAQRPHGIFSKLPFAHRLHGHARLRQLARHAKRTDLRIELLESRHAMHGGSMDLVALDDTGASDTDNITSETVWSVQATDLTAGAVVRIKNGDTVIGAEQTAGASTLTFSIDTAALGDGPITLTLEQNIADAGFVASDHLLTITKDTTLDTITTTPPAGPLTLGAAFSYDPAHAEEGQTGFTYQLVDAPSGETISIDSATGLVSWTPSAPDDYSFGIKFTDAAGNTATQAVNITVKPAAPGTPDLLAAADSGVDTDNITNSATLSFSVAGVHPDATVRLKIGNTVVGTQLANGATTVNVDVNNMAAFVQGEQQIVAEQEVNGIVSDVSAALTVTYDTQIAAITGTSPTTATVDSAVTFDAASADEGSIVYSLTGTVPAGATIAGDTGLLSWTPTAAQVGAHTFDIVATDVAGNTATKTISLTVSAAPPPAAPGVPDLVDASDSGSLNSDNITNAGALTFSVGNVLATATAVNLKLNGVVIGTVDPAGATTVNVSISNLAALTQGENQIVAEQIVDGVASDLSAALTVTYDTQIAAITGTSPTTATVDSAVSFDAASADEGSIVYSLTGTVPAGATIASDTGLLSWTPTAAQVGAHTFDIVATDVAGNTATKTISLTVSAAPPPAAPGVPDLVDASDSGSLNSDNITNAATLTFNVSGILATASAVNLKLNGVVIGTVNPAGASTVSVSIANPGALAQGAHEIVAEQIVDGVASSPSAAVTITYDTQIAAITGTPPTTGNVGTPISYNAGSADEGSVVYSLSAGAPSGATIDASTGVLSWTPAAGQTGANAFSIITTDTAGNTASQSLNITVTAATAPATPGAPDLQANSDTGTSNADNVTNATTWIVDVSSVTPGARVNIKHNGTIVGFGDATATSIAITISNVSQFADGDVVLTAEQVINNVTSAPSAALTIKKDTTLAGITSTPASKATSGVGFTYNAQHAEEATAGFVYSLVTPPNGATIDATTGVVSWTPSSAQVGSFTFGVKVTDLAGNTTTQNVVVDVARPLPALNAHLHADLSIFVNGVLVNIPNNLGIGPNGQIAFPHIEGNDNRIHVHPMDGTNANPTSPITLGDFFNTWRTNAGLPGNNPNATFSSTSLMGNNAVAGQTTVRMWVNGKPSTEFENYVLRDEDDITVSFETAGVTDGPTVAPIQNVTVMAGAPLYIPLNGFSPTGSNLTFSATSSNPSVLTTGISNTNRSIRINVAGYGDMTFELFEDKVGDFTSKIIALINANKYDNTIFHRVINGFVIQGGDPNGNGSNDEGQPEFDDLFHVDLQHTSSGLLSMAKQGSQPGFDGDDTNTSQFFITDAATRFLDFNHSIFGRLTSGDSVREAISNVAVNNSTENRPLQNVVMTNVEVFMDHANGTLMLKAPEGVTGTSNVTVTVTDADGKTYNQTFAVTVAADTSNSPNSPPILGPVANPTTTSGTAVNVQLTSTDVENGPVTYAINPNNVNMGSQPYTSTINNTTGLLTITPNAGFVGTFDIIVGVRQTANISTISDQWDTQTITVTVTPAAPAVPDLADASDLGLSNSDNITKGGSWTFTVGNVTNGALVKLYAGNQLLGSTTATGTTATIAFDSSILADGAVEISADQTVTINSVTHTSVRSAVATITKDTTAPAAFDLTNPIPTTAIINQAFSYNFVNPNEGAGFQYTLVNAPSGATIDASTGQLTWTPTAAQVGAQSFTVRFSDTAGNVVERAVNATVISDQAQLVQFFVRITDLNNNVITQIEQGEEFLVTIRVQDKRATPEGVFAAYLDTTYDPTKVSTVGSITYGDSFTNARDGSLATSGVLDEVGGAAGTTGLGAGVFNVYTMRFKANALGTASFATNPADQVPEHLVLLYNVGSGIPNAQITHASGSLNVVAPSGAVADDLTVIEDSQNNVLNVLSNDTAPSGVTGPFTIQAVTQPTAGGTVTISPDNSQLLFTPTANFQGNTSFTYTITNGAGFTDTTTVNLTVTNTNDPPTANDDTLTINEDANNSTLNVLANDSSSPDPTETLTITAITQPTSGGTVSIAVDGKSLIFNPTANFSGTVTFTYTMTDGTAGSTDTATVNLTVTAVNDNPTAGADSQTVTEDAAATTINVLANDSFAPDVNETLTVTAVTQGNQGGTITIGTGGANVIYTPKANFNGTETFTYTVSDGNGGTATATVTMTVTAVNDNPDAVADSALTIKNTGPLTINVLSNDTAAPDTGETLTITAITQPATGGTVAIASDGKSVIYTPTANFSGTVTFTYTINDGTTGSNDTATVTVTVQDFIPSDIAGYVYIDANHNGVRDAGEQGLAGVAVTLTGTATGNQTVNTTVTSQADGSYKFVNVAPGSYTVTQVQPAFMVDGLESLGAHGGNKSVNDKLSFTIAQDSHLTNYNFGEYGRQAQFVTMKDFLTSTPIGSSMMSVTSAGSVSWMQLGPSFSATTTASGSLNTAKTELTLTITENGQQLRAVIAMSDATKVKMLGQSNGAMLLRVLGTRTSLGFTPVTTTSAQGEAASTLADTSSAAAAPQGETAPPADSTPAAQNELPGPQAESNSGVDVGTAAALSAPLAPVGTTSYVSSNADNSYSSTSDTASSSTSSPADAGSSVATASMADSYGSSESSDDEASADEADAVVTEETQSRDEAISDWQDNAWNFLTSEEEEEGTDGASEEEVVDALMAEGEWQD